MPKTILIKDPWPGREDLYDELAKRKRRQGRTNKDLAEAVRLSRSRISLKLNQDPGSFRLSEFLALCNALGMDIVEGIKILRGGQV